MAEGKIEDETRLVYGWLSDDITAFDKTCVLKDEAKADAPGLGVAPEDYLATSLRDYVHDAYSTEGTDVDDTLPYQMYRAALKRVNWGQIAEWAMRDDERFPPLTDGEEVE